MSAPPAIKIMYIINVVVSIIAAVVLSPMYIDLLNDNIKFLGTDNGKMLKFLIVTFGFVTAIGLIIPSFAAYDETERELTKFLKSKGIVGAPSFRSV